MIFWYCFKLIFWSRFFSNFSDLSKLVNDAVIFIIPRSSILREVRESKLEID